MDDQIPGINRTSLWKAWKAIRPQLKKSSIRDVVDFLEYDINPDVWIYESTNRKRFRAWLYYNQYRKYLVFDKVYPYIVTTDITNFFDSILYSRVSEYLHAVSVPPRLLPIKYGLTKVRSTVM
jgi:hypothetical protein